MTDFLTVAHVAKRLGISTSTVYDLARQRKISHCRVGVGRGRLLFTPQDIDDYLKARRVEADSASPTLRFSHSRY
jgi:excisionase family DNA binding protein